MAKNTKGLHAHMEHLRRKYRYGLMERRSFWDLLVSSGYFDEDNRLYKASDRKEDVIWFPD